MNLNYNELKKEHVDQHPKILKKENLDDEVSLAARLDMGDYFGAGEDSEKKVLSEIELARIRQRDAVLHKAQEEAVEIRERAKKIYLQVEDRIREAKEQGYADGREEGLASLTELLTTIRQNNIELFAGLEKEALKLVYEIAHKLIGDAFKITEDALLGMIQQALTASMGNALTILVHPDDYERLKTSQARLMANLHGSQVLTLRPAETVKLNSCVIESELGTVEANLDSQLIAIKKVLGLTDLGSTE